MDIRKRLFRAVALRSGTVIDERWLCVSLDDKDPYGYHHAPCGPGRDEIYRHSGIDVYDKSRLPQDPFAASVLLACYRRGGWDVNPAPGDLWRLASIAKGFGDPAGRTNPGPLPEVDAAEAEAWVPVIDWRRLPKNGGRGGVYGPKARFGMLTLDQTASALGRTAAFVERMVEAGGLRPLSEKPTMFARVEVRRAKDLLDRRRAAIGEVHRIDEEERRAAPGRMA